MILIVRLSDFLIRNNYRKTNNYLFNFLLFVNQKITSRKHVE